MSFQATNLHAGQPNTHCVILICHQTERGNEFHLYGTEGIGSRFLSYQSDWIQRIFHLFCAANSNKTETTAATVTTGQNDNNITVQPSAIPIDIQTVHNKIEPVGQNLTGQIPATPNPRGPNPATPNPPGLNPTTPNPTTPNLTGPDLTEQNPTGPPRQDKTPVDQTQQDKAWQAQTLQGKTPVDQTQHDKGRQDKTQQDQPRQVKTPVDQTQQDKAWQDQTQQDQHLLHYRQLLRNEKIQLRGVAKHVPLLIVGNVSTVWTSLSLVDQTKNVVNASKEFVKTDLICLMCQRSQWSWQGKDLGVNKVKSSFLSYWNFSRCRKVSCPLSYHECRWHARTTDVKFPLTLTNFHVKSLREFRPLRFECWMANVDRFKTTIQDILLS